MTMNGFICPRGVGPVSLQRGHLQKYTPPGNFPFSGTDTDSTSTGGRGRTYTTTGESFRYE